MTTTTAFVTQFWSPHLRIVIIAARKVQSTKGTGGEHSLRKKAKTVSPFNLEMCTGGHD